MIISNLYNLLLILLQIVLKAMPTHCIFQLDRLNATYSSGEFICGRILIKTDKVKRVNAVFVTLEGEAKVQWSISCKTETANYYGHQQYLYTRTNVHSNADFRSGTHVYGLSLRIPPECPSSCKGPYGHIVYYVSLTIKKPWSLDEVFRKSINVVQTLDLNVNPEYALPITDENVRYLCRWPCTSGPLSATLVIGSTGFAPRQNINYFLEVDNQSPHYDVLGIEALFRQHFVFLARKPLKRNFYTKTLAKSCIVEPTLRLTKRLYEGTIRVPDDIPRSTLNPNYIVYLHYTLLVRLKTGCFHYDMDIIAPLVIGTVALRNRNMLITTQPTTRSREALETDDELEEVRELNTQTGLPDDEPPSYDSCLPPSFSYATLSSQQTLEHSNQESNNQEHTRLHVVLPKFPDYDMLTASTQAINASTTPRQRYKSYGSLDVADDHMGQSLDTFGSSCGILTESEENIFEGDDEA